MSPELIAKVFFFAIFAVLLVFVVWIYVRIMRHSLRKPEENE